MGSRSKRKRCPRKSWFKGFERAFSAFERAFSAFECLFKTFERKITLEGYSFLSAAPKKSAVTFAEKIRHFAEKNSATKSLLILNFRFYVVKHINFIE